MFSIVPRIISEEVEPVLRMADELTRLPRTVDRYMAQPFCQLGESEVHNTDKEFRIRMDLQHFKPEEVKITSDNKRVTVHAKHEEKQDTHGFVSREITRVYKLPELADAKSVTSTMNNQGVLSIKVEKRAPEVPTEIDIPVQFK